MVLEEEEEGGGSSNKNGGTSQIELRSKLSPTELTWLRGYASLVTAYKGEFLDILDIASPLSSSSAAGSSRSQGRHLLDFKPPDELMVTVVATRDAREVMTEMGMLNLRKGERMRVRRNEVEGLIIRGWLEVMDD